MLIAAKGKPEDLEFAPADLSAIWQIAQANVVRGRFSTISLEALEKWTDRFTSMELNEFVIPKRTLARRREAKESLTVEETDKALRLARISSETDKVFGDVEKSDRWLRKPNDIFAGQTPLELLKSEAGALAVEELLGQIDHGMFA